MNEMLNFSNGGKKNHIYDIKDSKLTLDSQSVV